MNLGTIPPSGQPRVVAVLVLATAEDRAERDADARGDR